MGRGGEGVCDGFMIREYKTYFFGDIPYIYTNIYIYIYIHIMWDVFQKTVSASWSGFTCVNSSPW